MFLGQVGDYTNLHLP